MSVFFNGRFIAAIAAGLMFVFSTSVGAQAEKAPVVAAPGASNGLTADSSQAGSFSPLTRTPLSVSSGPAQQIRRTPSLNELVATFVDYGDQDAEEECLAKAVYFEARSESLEGQLAVANVVLNRSRSGVYPSTICKVVTQPWQFSFIRRGKFPSPDTSSKAWHRAAAIAAIAQKNSVQVLPPNVLWYHANYVAPTWGRRLTRVAQIGVHIFYS